MIKDSRKNLNFTYNVLNLLLGVKTGTASTAKYSYLADGTKLGVFDGSNNGFYYLGSLTYVKDGGTIRLESGMFDKGRIVANASTRSGNETRYFLTDHLGSIRAIVDQTGAVKERDDYYPFGGRYAVSGSSVDAGSRLKYNGKEEQVTGNLGWLDYGTRMYNWETGRWFVPDILGEKRYSFSSYAYVLDNPIIFIDVNGLIDWKVVGFGLLNTVGGVINVAAGIACGSTGIGAVVGGFLVVEGGANVAFGVSQMLLGFADPTEKTAEIAASLPTGVVDMISIGVDKVVGNEHDEIRNIAALATIWVTWKSGSMLEYGSKLKNIGDLTTFSQSVT